MRLSDQSKKSFHIALALFFLIMAALGTFWFRPARMQALNVERVFLGTNQVHIGENLYHPNGYHVGKVIQLDDWYEFPDGTNRPGVLVRATNHYETWIPREKMNKLMVQ